MSVLRLFFKYRVSGSVKIFQGILQRAGLIKPVFFVFLFLFGFASLLPGAVVAHGASLTTDKTDYDPGETIIIDGTGFWTDEDVDLWVEILGDPGGICGGIWSVTADGNGDFTTSWFICQEAEGESLLVSALGQSSGLTASREVGDCNTRLELISVPTCATQNSSFQATALLRQKCGGGGFAPLANREVRFFITEGNCGVDIGQYPDATGTTDANGEVTVTLTAPSYDFGVRAKFLKEKKPSPCLPPGNNACNPGTCVTLSATNACEAVPLCPPCDLSITCPPDVPIECDELTDPVNTGTATATGTCPPIVVTYSDNITPGICTQEYTITRTWTATDDDGNEETCDQIITVEDNTAPQITCPAAIYVQCPADVPPPDILLVTATDNCDPSPTIIHVSDISDGLTCPETIIRTYRATDDCGNSADCTQIITVHDTQNPVAQCPGNITVNVDPGQCSAVVDFTATVTDNCPGATIVCNPPSGSTFPVGTTTVTCTATDACGNTDVCTFTVTVNDNEDPVALCPGDAIVYPNTGQCEAASFWQANVTDNCPGATISCTPASGSTFPVGINTVTCTATDASGNTDVCTFTVTVIDNQDPTAYCPADMIVDTDLGLCGAVVTFTATVWDNCPGATISCTPPSGSTFPVGTTTVTCTAIDASGNTDVCTFTVTVQDNEDPVALCPANITVNNDPGLCDAVVVWTATATDNCPGVSISCLPPSGSTFPVGVTTVTCTATDASGNTDVCSFTVTVVDNEDPVASCPGDITVDADPAQCDAVVNFTATVSDNCPGASIVCSPPSGSTFPVFLYGYRC